MRNTTIIIGNSAATTQEVVQKFGFLIVDFKVDWPEEPGVSGNNLFEKMREAKRMGVKTTPKTSQPSIGAFKKAFEEALEKTQYALAITISSGISGTYNSAFQAKKMFDEEKQKRIFIVDSFNADAAETLLAIKAAEMDENGIAIDEIVKKLEILKPNTKLFGMLESPYWLEAGGRINHTVAVLLEQMQKIGMRPLLTMKDGVVKPANLKMQAKDTANALFKELETLAKAGFAENKKITLAISHSDDLFEAEKLKDMLIKSYPQIKIEFLTLMVVKNKELVYVEL
jgi:DegV family protein with EDD domain